MFHPRPVDELHNQPWSQIFAALMTGRPLMGGVLDWPGQVVPLLSSRVPQRPLFIDNATFDVVDLALAEKREVVFRRCLFLDPVFGTGGSTLGRITFVDCRFERPFVLKGVALACVKLDRCEFADRCLMEIDSQLEIVELSRCVFSGSLRLTLEHSAAPTDSHHVNIYDCEFRHFVVVEIHAPVQEVALDNCEFGESSLTEFFVPATIQSLSFQGSSILGQMAISGPSSHDLAALADDGKEFIAPKLYFKSTIIKGNLNLRHVIFASMDLEEATIVNGGLELGENQLRLREESGTLGAREGCYDRLSRQYEMLSRALPRLPQTSAGEDTCLFRMRYYKQLADIEKVGCVAYRLAIAAIWILFVLVVATITFAPWPWMVCVISGLALALAGVTWDPWGWVPVHVSDSLLAAWDRIVLRGMLGYGVRVRNVLGSSAAWMVVFALIYWTSTSSASYVGWIEVDDRNYVQVLRQEPRPPDRRAWDHWSRCKLAEFRDSMYYSVITFTTVGYGDFRPQGRLRGVAACEALLGAIMIALVTVIFARKYLRL